MEQLKKGIILIKYLLTALLVMFIVSLTSTGKASSASLDQVREQVMKAVDLSELSQADPRTVKRFYGINVNDYEDAVLYMSDSNMKVEEMLIVKLKDSSQAETVEAAVQSRLDRQLESFEGYGPEQCRLLEGHVLDTKGNYVLFMVHEEAKTAEQAFLKAL